MKAIVFGGSGFLGSHVADELSDRGHEVVIYDRQESPYLRDNQEMVVGDILNYEKVAEYVKGCDYVYSFAGVAGISDARLNPLRTIKTNVIGTTNIVDACRLYKVNRFIFASTIYVYSDMAPFYRSSKQACELILEDYQQVYGLDYTILRYGSLYGRRANHFNYINKIVRQAVEEGRIIRKGNGEEIRSYIHVKDAAKCSVDIISDEFKNQYVILTGNQSIKIKDLLNMVREMFHGEISVEYSGEPEEGHYEITPYSFRPRVAKKIVAGSYYDLGQGILDVIYEVYSRSDKNAKHLSSIQRLVEAKQG
jgi:UDP-glucose 4-epimerase